jgi:drug/metabolite transporter (DMT)-like permease
MFHPILYLVAIFALGQAAGLVRLAQAPPDVIGAWRLGMAALILAPMVFWRRQPTTGARNTSQLPLPTIILSGAFFYTHLWTYFFAIHHTSIARCMIIFATNPLFATLGSRFFFREKLFPRFYVAFPLAFLGLLILFFKPLFSIKNSLGINWGDGAALLSAILYAAYILLGKKARNTTSNITYSFIIYLIAAILFTTIGSLKGLNFFEYPQSTWWALLGTVLIPTFMGHFLFSYLLRFLNPGMMSTGKLFEPIIASLMAVWLFSEPLSLELIFSFALTGSAVLILVRPISLRSSRQNP